MSSPAHCVSEPLHVLFQVQPLCAWQVDCVENVPHADGVPEHVLVPAFHVQPSRFWQVVWVTSDEQLVGKPEHDAVDWHPRQLLQPYTEPHVEQDVYVGDPLQKPAPASDAQPGQLVLEQPRDAPHCWHVE